MAKKSTNIEESVLVKNEGGFSLPNRRVNVTMIPKKTPLVTSKNHVLASGRAPGATVTICVPVKIDGSYVQVLTEEEQECLVKLMGLPKDALSSYLRVNNYWDNYSIKLNAEDKSIDLSTPEGYIEYKVLAANKHIIATSAEEHRKNPDSEHLYLLSFEDERAKRIEEEADLSINAIMLLNGIRDDRDTMRAVLERLTGAALSLRVDRSFLLNKLTKVAQESPKRFIEVAGNENLASMVVLKKAAALKLIFNKGGKFYRLDNTPICNVDEEPTLENASAYLSRPQNQEELLTLKASIKDAEK
nr:MAG TPA: hypothetical protein [Crassvirales sp.]